MIVSRASRRAPRPRRPACASGDRDHRPSTAVPIANEELLPAAVLRAPSEADADDRPRRRGAAADARRRSPARRSSSASPGARTPPRRAPCSSRASCPFRPPPARASRCTTAFTPVDGEPFADQRRSLSAGARATGRRAGRLQFEVETARPHPHGRRRPQSADRPPATRAVADPSVRRAAN